MFLSASPLIPLKSVTVTFSELKTNHQLIPVSVDFGISKWYICDISKFSPTKYWYWPGPGNLSAWWTESNSLGSKFCAELLYIKKNWTLIFLNILISKVRYFHSCEITKAYIVHIPDTINQFKFYLNFRSEVSIIQVVR